MRGLNWKKFLRGILLGLGNFLLFFLIISVVVTCTFLVFFAAVTLPEEDIRAFAPVVFINVFVLAAIFVAVDVIRRKLTVDRHAREIQKGLQRLAEGDFGTRIKMTSLMDRESRFSEIARGINLLAGELEGVETLRTDFIANVSHELKTPLAVMQNYAAMLQQPGLSEEKRLEYVRAVMDASRRLSNLITNVLKLNKLENQQIFPDSKEYDLSEQLCECLLQFENEWEKKEIEIDTFIEEELHIQADEELLSLVWNNLLSNAFKFTGQGGKVSVGLLAEGEYAVVTVSDTGCGMSPEVGAHIFEKFYQGDNSHATQGNGLGLALVKRVVDITDGEIYVESVLGKGSTFRVKIRRKVA